GVGPPGVAARTVLTRRSILLAGGRFPKVEGTRDRSVLQVLVRDALDTVFVRLERRQRLDREIAQAPVGVVLVTEVLEQIYRLLVGSRLHLDVLGVELAAVRPRKLL